MNVENPFELVEHLFSKDGHHWLSPDGNREFLLMKNCQGGWTLILSNLGYLNPDHKKPSQRRTVLSLDVSSESGAYIPTSIGLEAVTSPDSRSAVNILYPCSGQKIKGSQNTILKMLISQLNKGLPTEASLPRQINVAATAAGFVRKVIEGDFSDPVLVPAEIVKLP